jgi:hypothetical protein
MAECVYFSGFYLKALECARSLGDGQYLGNFQGLDLNPDIPDATIVQIRRGAWTALATPGPTRDEVLNLRLQMQKFVEEPLPEYAPCWCCYQPVAMHTGLHKCDGCGKARYCDKACQEKGWEEHRQVCMRRDIEATPAAVR